MNERIRELVKQAGGHFATHNLMSNPVQHRESIELWDNNIEKFAELIVRECSAVALEQKKWVEDMQVHNPHDETWNRARIQQSQHIADKIKEHFGVEE